jgi:F420-non-reducing hydrogenase iron-sulfur subunit
MSQFGIEKERFQLHWISAAEAKRFVDVVTKMTDEVRALGPLNWPGMIAEVDAEGENLKQHLEEVVAAAEK